MSNKKTYKEAFKGTTIFGGVQFVVVIFSILKSKVMAVLLGTEGFGIISLFNSVISFISSIAQLGLPSSSVKEFSELYASNSKEKLSSSVKSLSRWARILGLIGGVLTILLSPLLSRWAFGSDDYIVSFVLLSIIIFVSTLTGINNAVIQGCRKLIYLAQSKIGSSFIALAFSIPIFYFFKEKGIIYYLIIVAVAGYLISVFYIHKLKKKNIFTNVKQSYRESYSLGVSSVNLGVMMALSNISVFFMEIVVKSFIREFGGVEDVGLYQASWAINASYLGLIFTAMATDYYPRLSSIASDHLKVREAVNQQAEIALLILGPLIVLMVLFLPLVIRVLYTEDFMSILTMTKLLLVGSIFKAGAWAISFIFLAKGHGKAFLFNELGIKLITLPSYLLGYYYGGLVGVGIAFNTNYILYFIWVFIRANNMYKFAFARMFIEIFLVQLAFVGGAYFISNNILSENYIILYGLYVVIGTTSVYYSFVKLDKMIDIRAFIKKKIDEKRNKK